MVTHVRSVQRGVDARSFVQVASGIPRRRIVVAGFSQGGALALHFALRHAEPLAGCIALSSWLPLRESYPAQLGLGARKLPLLLAHGDADLVVPLAWGQLGHDRLRECGLDVRTVTAGGVGHGVDAMVLGEVADFLGRVLDGAL